MKTQPHPATLYKKTYPDIVIPRLESKKKNEFIGRRTGQPLDERLANGNDFLLKDDYLNLGEIKNKMDLYYSESDSSSDEDSDFSSTSSEAQESSAEEEETSKLKENKGNKSNVINNKNIGKIDINSIKTIDNTNNIKKNNVEFSQNKQNANNIKSNNIEYSQKKLNVNTLNNKLDKLNENDYKLADLDAESDDESSSEEISSEALDSPNFKNDQLKTNKSIKETLNKNHITTTTKNLNVEKNQNTNTTKNLNIQKIQNTTINNLKSENNKQSDKRENKKNSEDTYEERVFPGIEEFNLTFTNIKKTNDKNKKPLLNTSLSTIKKREYNNNSITFLNDNELLENNFGKINIIDDVRDDEDDDDEAKNSNDSENDKRKYSISKKNTDKNIRKNPNININKSTKNNIINVKKSPKKDNNYLNIENEYDEKKKKLRKPSNDIKDNKFKRGVDGKKIPITESQFIKETYQRMLDSKSEYKAISGDNEQYFGVSNRYSRRIRIPRLNKLAGERLSYNMVKHPDLKITIPTLAGVISSNNDFEIFKNEHKIKKSKKRLVKGLKKNTREIKQEENEESESEIFQLIDLPEDFEEEEEDIVKIFPKSQKGICKNLQVYLKCKIVETGPKNLMIIGKSKKKNLKKGEEFYVFPSLEFNFVNLSDEILRIYLHVDENYEKKIKK